MTVESREHVVVVDAPRLAAVVALADEAHAALASKKVLYLGGVQAVASLTETGSDADPPHRELTAHVASHEAHRLTE
jgi:hypothetical protein